jgi:hypothetical protein
MNGWVQETEKNFTCEHCEADFVAERAWIFKHTKDGETEASLNAICPECKKKTSRDLVYILQRGVVNPTVPKTDVKSIIKDRPQWY